MNRIDCPDAHNWQALLDGERCEGEAEELTRHLETCTDCQQTLEILAALPRYWEDTACALGGQRRITDREPALRHVMDRLKDENFSMPEADLSFLQPADDPNLLGLLDSYQVREVIGRGGNGVVLQAFDPVLHRLVAIKVLDPTLASNATARRRFTREAQAAAAVCHDNIVPVHGVSEAGGLPYLVMQYIAGESLQARLNREGSLEATDTVRIGLQTASGLAAAHAQGLIHRDIKPANLLLENGISRVKITDFGLARMSDDVCLTQNGVVAGTPEYMAPEQARGEVVDHRADLFSLGSVLYSCCTGSPPFRGSTALSVLSQVSDKEPRPIRSLNPDVPSWLEAFIARLMTKDPAQRFQSAAEVVPLLESYLAHLRQPSTVPMPKVPSLAGFPVERSGKRSSLRFARRVRRRTWLSALAALVIAGLGIYLWCQSDIQPLTPAGKERVEEGSKWGKQDHLRVDLSAGIDKLPPSLSLLLNPDAIIKADSQGWRITLPAGRKNSNNVTLVALNRLSGDFTITMGYEVLDLGKPWPQWGAGPSMRVWFDTPNEQTAILSRSHTPDGQWFKCHKTFRGSDGKTPFVENRDAKASRSRGKLRLVRRGSMLDFFVMEEGQKDFTHLQSGSFGEADVPKIEFYCTTNYTPIALDVRWTELDIRADRIESPNQPSSPKREQDHIQVDLPAGIDKLSPSLSLFGPDVDSVVKADSQGWRITLPAGRENPKDVTLAISNRLSGDFAITVGYELISLGTPLPEYGAGTAMRVWFDTPNDLSAILSRSNKPNGQWYGCHKTRKEPDGKESFFDNHHAKATKSRGKLRLVRKGSELRYFAMEEGQDFRLLQSVKIGAEDVRQVEIYCTTMHTPIELDIRWTELDIQADKIEGPNQPPGLKRKQDHIRVDLPAGIDKLPPSLAMFGPNMDSVVTADSQGWRFNLPAGRANTDNVGVQVLPRLHGDFSITLGYELQNVGEPWPRFGAGVWIRIWFDTPSFLSAMLTRNASSYHKPPRQAFAAFKILKGADGKEQYLDTRTEKAYRSRGKLCLQRSGSRLQYFIAEEGKTFRLLNSVEIGTADVQKAQVFCGTSSIPVGLDVRWTELDIRADQIEDQKPQTQVHLDLRSADLTNSILQPIDENVRLEAEGARVTLPAGEDLLEPSGLIAKATIHGDFEITGSYEILKADRPSDGYGVGVGLYAAIDAHRNHAVSLARRVLSDGETLFVSDRMIPTEEKLTHLVKTLPSKKTAGKVRLQRVGSRIRFLVAEEGQSDFVLVDEVEFSNEDIHLFKFEGNTGGARNSLDCRLLDFTLRAEKVENPALPKNAEKW